MIKELLAKVSAKQDLTFDEAKQAIDEIMSGEVSEAVISSFLTALAMKGETEEEIAKITTAVLQGKGTKAQNTAVALNAGAAIYAGELGITLKDAVKKAENIISSGEGYKILEGFVKVTNE